MNLPVTTPNLSSWTSMRKALVCLMFAVLLTLGITTLLRMGGFLGLDSLHSDPNKVRPWAQDRWDELHTINTSTSPLDSRYQPQVTFIEWQPHPSSVPGKAVTQWMGLFQQGNQAPASYQGDFQTVRLTPEKPGFEINGEPVTFRFFGHALPRHETLTEPLTDESNSRSRMRMAFYTSNGSAVSLDTVRTQLPEGMGQHIQETFVSWWAPYALSFFMEYPESLDVSFDYPGVYDPVTYVGLSSGQRHRAESGSLQMSTSIKDLASASTELVLDMFHGPIMTKSIEEPQAGARLETPHFTVVILGMGPGKYSEAGYGHDRGTFEISLTVRENTEESHSFFVFAFGPRDVNRRLKIEAVDAEGNSADVHVVQSGNLGAFARAEMPYDQIRALNFHYRTNATRIFFETSLHAVSEENRGIQDLFDVRIPIFRASDEGSLRQMIAQFAQLRNRSQAQLTLPESAFPMTFERMTLREILVEYLKMRPDVTAYVDKTEMELVFDDGSRDKPFTDILSEWFKGLWPIFRP